jgi:hypothetical protein
MPIGDTRQPAQRLKTPPGLIRAAFDITFPPTGSSSLPCQRKLRKLRGSTMPSRRFLLRLAGSVSAWSPEPNISYHSAQTTVKPLFSTRSRILTALRPARPERARWTNLGTSFDVPATVQGIKYSLNQKLCATRIDLRTGSDAEWTSGTSGVAPRPWAVGARSGGGDFFARIGPNPLKSPDAEK